MKTIMMVEDEAGIREMTKKYLRWEGYEVITAENGERALKILNSNHPDLILLDIEMPGLDGFSICKKIRRNLTVPIIFLTVRRDVIDKVKCFELGGDDFITKPFEFQELNARIKAHIRRYFSYPKPANGILTFNGLEINLQNFKCYVNGRKVPLSTKETELLIYLAKHADQVLSQEQLYDNIWSNDAVGNVNTVKVHISHLRHKIEENPKNPKYIKTIRGFGYMFSGK